MTKPKYFNFSFPSGDPAGIARCAYDKMAIYVMMQNNMIPGGN